MIKMYLNRLAAALVFAVSLSAAAHAETLNVYGPGGPAPAMKELATIFGKKHGITVEVTAGPTEKWLGKAKADAHIIFSGAENMMLDFVKKFDGAIDTDTVEPVYLRPTSVLVRKGNPKGLTGLRDLAKSGIKVLVTEGAGQVGMWEDAAGRTGEISLIKGIRKNIVEVADNSGIALKTWVEKPEIDAWVIWNHWQIENPKVADLVPVEPELTIWRTTDVAFTKKGRDTPTAVAFVEFIKSPEGEAVFRRWGWKR